MIYNDVEYSVNATYSFKDFTGQDLSDKKVEGVVYNSCFSQEILDREIFNPNTNATFIRCNLSNVKMPSGCIVIDCNTTRFKCCNDLRDWIIDESNTPIKVINEKYWQQNGYSCDPKDIPLEKISCCDEIKKVGE